MTYHEVSLVENIPYGPDERHVFDLHKPDLDAAPVVVYVHGGGFSHGDKAAPGERQRAQAMARRGVAVAAINYRLLPDHLYPSQVKDAKSVVALLRESGDRYGISADKVGVWGASAGGYVASMVGLTGLDPDLGDLAGRDLSVDAVVSWFAPSDLRERLSRSWLEERALGSSPEYALLGVSQADDVELVRAASPIYRVRAGTPPFLLVHGDHDKMVPLGQSLSLHNALVQAGNTSTFVTVGGVGHEAHEFDEPPVIDMTAAFLIHHLA